MHAGARVCGGAGRAAQAGAQTPAPLRVVQPPRRPRSLGAHGAFPGAPPPPPRRLRARAAPTSGVVAARILPLLPASWGGSTLHAVAANGQALPIAASYFSRCSRERSCPPPPRRLMPRAAAAAATCR